MSVQTRHFVDVAAKAQELGCRVPVGVALLPGNLSTAAHSGEFCYHAATPQVRSAWQRIGLEDEGPAAAGGDMAHSTRSVILSESNESKNLFARSGQAQSASIGIVSQADTPAESAKLPLVVFFGAGLLDGSAWRVTVALGMVSSVFASLARRTGQRDVRLDVVVERPGDRGYACIEYRGDAFGIVALARDVRRVWTGK